MTGLPEVIVVIPAAAVFLAGIGARSTPELDALADAAVAELAPVAAADAVGVLAARGTTRDSDPGAPAATLGHS
jgi:hypothetical protein